MQVDRGFHRERFLPLDIIVSRMFTGHPQTCVRGIHCSHLFVVKLKERVEVDQESLWFTRNTNFLESLVEVSFFELLERYSWGVTPVLQDILSIVLSLPAAGFRESC